MKICFQGNSYMANRNPMERNKKYIIRWNGGL